VAVQGKTVSSRPAIQEKDGLLDGDRTGSSIV